ncbi:MAG: SpoIID/LytB domain-containing protein [Candidatus Kerfeldbacteria bacterium]|nr:SpoIID/LytB domain-containing protein [Candidatus Kerfeldbacteria bacterium]
MKYVLAAVTIILGAVVVQPAQAGVERPKIRVGLYETTAPITVVVSGNSIIRTASNTALYTLPKDTVATLSYDSTTALYTVAVGDWSVTSTEAIKIDPKKKNKISTITSYSNPPAWDTSLNDNMFYGSVELNDGWVVNELGIENYVKGVSEAGNDNEPAYLKALYTAARTYVYFHYLYPTKHAGEPYLVDATANDQVYRGYGFTSRAPNIVSAVDATAGQVITYEDAVVVTPYFSQSDGRTRAWSEVWGGDYAYLQSVDDPGCAGDTLLGHGVGMSAAGARYFANEQYWHWREILQYYYQGVELTQLW